MGSVMDRTLAIIELLAAEPAGLPLHVVADGIGMPRSAAHRLLTELGQQGYVRQLHDTGRYGLTIKLVALGLSYLSRAGNLDVVQPILDDLAASTGELVRLSVIDGEQLIWVAKAQGARSGLRYDPDMGATAHLASTASGHAWLSTLDDDTALSLVARQGLGDPKALGPSAPRSLKAVRVFIHRARVRGYATQMESFVPGTSTIAVPVRRATRPGILGVLSIAGPVVRLTQARMDALAPELSAAAALVTAASAASSLFNAAPSAAPQAAPDARQIELQEG